MKKKEKEQVEDILDRVRKVVFEPTSDGGDELNSIEDYINSEVALVLVKSSGMDKSKQLICGSRIVLQTIISSLLQNLYTKNQKNNQHPKIK